MKRLPRYRILLLVLLFSLSGLAWSCEEKPVDPTPGEYELPALVKPTQYSGIPLLTNDMARFRSTDMNSEYVVRTSLPVTTTLKTERNGYNAVLAIEYDGLAGAEDYLELALSVFDKIPDEYAVPSELTDHVNGISFRAVSPGQEVELSLQVLDANNGEISSGIYTIATDTMFTYTLDFDPGNIKEIRFRVDGEDQSADFTVDNRLLIDDIYLLTSKHEEFEPPADDLAFLAWLKGCSMRYFLWNYREVGEDKGVVLEAAGDNNKVSLSGLGYALANLILAEMEGMIPAQDAEEKVLAVLKWLHVQNWFDGTHGWHGFPNHYFNREGSYYSSDVSTIDWAMCAAGIRVARAYYHENQELVTMATDILDRAKWDEAIGDDGRIAMGFNESDGAMNPYRWGLAFSEETELVYLEALASGKVEATILDKVIRAKEEGFYPSWYGCGFTYNWLQLWTGTIEPYRTNSIAAYTADYETSASAFGMDVMGLTACATIRDVTENGFINWGRYISNQGSDVSGASATEVIHISPAPYGAALALPFVPEKAMSALRGFVELGYVHPLLGLPDNIRLNNLPSGLSPAPNWNTFDINTGPISLAIEQAGENRIGLLYQADSEIATALPLLIDSFTF